MSGERVLLRQLDLFLFAVCLIRCPFMELPVGERREGGGRSLPCCSQREAGLEGGRDMKRDVRNVIMSSPPEKCRCFSK